MVKLGVSTRPESLALGSISCVPDANGKQKKGKRRMSEQKKSQSLEEPATQGPRSRQNPPLSRSKTYDPSFSKETEKEATSSKHRNSVSNLVKHAINFHRAFKDLPEEEELVNTFSCAWQRDVPYHGRLYVSASHVCFYCSMLRREVKVIIPVQSISVLKKANTALLVPNAISIRTAEGEKFLFGSLRSRETTYQLLRSVCKHLQDGSRNCSPTFSRSGSDHLKISLISRELDPSYVPPAHDILLDVPDGVSGTETPLKAAGEETHPPRAPTCKGRERLRKPSESWSSHLSLLNAVIFIYLFLVGLLLLSSGYLGLRIVQLEEQLTSLGAWSDLDFQQRYKAM